MVDSTHIDVAVRTIEGRDRGNGRLILDATVSGRRGSITTEFPLMDAAFDLEHHGIAWRVWLHPTDAEYTTFDVESATACPWVR
ncbi:MAG: hypothetical protein DWI58_21175 [Chloroflexi bacterium]|nr:MAG: hypothetical protein DWI58_21175 [Chloroflexota bacterium]